MDILLIAATEAEIAILIKSMDTSYEKLSEGVYGVNEHTVTIRIAGVGMVATTYNLTTALAGKRYDLVVQAGIAGSFDRDIKLGDVVCVKAEQFGDLGAEDHDDYLDIFSLGLTGNDEPPFSNRRLNVLSSSFYDKIDLPKVNGLTVNMVSGNEKTIKCRLEIYKPQVETMEGAAFHYVCLKQNLPFLQIRGISNYVEPRNRDNWQIKQAIISLNTWLSDFFSTL